jgi:hypothetical protein
LLRQRDAVSGEGDTQQQTDQVPKTDRSVHDMLPSDSSAAGWNSPAAFVQSEEISSSLAVELPPKSTRLAAAA